MLANLVSLYQERPVESCNELLHRIHSSVAYTSCSCCGTGTWFAPHFFQQVVCAGAIKRLFIPSYLVQEYLFHLKSTTDFKQSNLSRLIPAILSTVLQWHSSSGNFEWSHLWFVIHLSCLHWIALPLSAFERGRSAFTLKTQLGWKPGAICHWLPWLPLKELCDLDGQALRISL